MIDAKNITKFNQTYPQLEENLLFWVCAAGKNGVTSAKCLDKFLRLLRKIDLGYNPSPPRSPFKLIRELDENISEGDWIAKAMKYCGIGCYNQKSAIFKHLAYTTKDTLDLKACSVQELERIKGIGPKTARCFLIHSRPNQRLAGLDTHILKFLRDKGIKNVPKSTPTGKRYAELEKVFIKLADKAKQPIADFDLKIWNQYRK